MTHSSEIKDLILSMEKTLPPILYFNLQALEYNRISPRDPIELSDILQYQNLWGEDLPGSDEAQEEPANKLMDCFPPESLQDFKHVIYNLLAEAHNNPGIDCLVQPYTVKEYGIVRHGFRLNSRLNPERKIPEVYAEHIKKARLDLQDQSSVFIQDLYRYYMRACLELLSKYFEKRDRYTYLYGDTLLFIPNESLELAEERIKTLRSRARKRPRDTKSVSKLQKQIQD